MVMELRLRNIVLGYVLGREKDRIMGTGSRTWGEKEKERRAFPVWWYKSQL